MGMFPGRIMVPWHTQLINKSNIVSICVAPPKTMCNNSKKGLKAYTMLYCCSQETFLNRELAKKLRTEGTMTSIKIKTLNVEERQETEAISDLKVTSSTGKNIRIDLPVPYTREIYHRTKDIATLDKIKNWKYLKRTDDKIIQGKYISIGLLIGSNCSRALEPLEIISSKEGCPYAFRTLLGWCIVGPISKTASITTVSRNTVSVQDVTSKTLASHYFTMKTEVKDVGIEQMIHRMYAPDFSDHCLSKRRRKYNWEVIRG